MALFFELLHRLLPVVSVSNIKIRCALLQVLSFSLFSDIVFHIIIILHKVDCFSSYLDNNNNNNKPHHHYITTTLLLL